MYLVLSSLLVLHYKVTYSHVSVLAVREYIASKERGIRHYNLLFM